MDERLRALGRAAPHDALAAWAHVHALERAGDVEAAWRARCRLARGGDERAWRELGGDPAPVRAPGRVLSRTGDLWFAAAAGEVVLLAARDRLVAVSARDLSELWTVPAAHSVPRAAPVCCAPTGPLLVHAPSRPVDAVVLRSMADGRELARVPLPRADGTLLRVAATADRAAVWAVHGQAQVVTLLDVSGRRALAHREQPWPGRRDEALLRGLIVGSDGDDVVGSELPGGPCAWRHEGSFRTYRGGHDRFLLVKSRRAAGEWLALDLADGALRPIPGAEPAIDWHLAGDLVVGQGLDGDGLLVRGVAGRASWSAALDGLALISAQQARDVLYALVRGDAGLAVFAFQAADGVRLWSRALDLPGPGPDPWLVPVERGALVCWTHDGRSELRLIQEDDSVH